MQVLNFRAMDCSFQGGQSAHDAGEAILGCYFKDLVLSGTAEIRVEQQHPASGLGHGNCQVARGRGLAIAGGGRGNQQLLGFFVTSSKVNGGTDCSIGFGNIGSRFQQHLAAAHRGRLLVRDGWDQTEDW